MLRVIAPFIVLMATVAGGACSLAAPLSPEPAWLQAKITQFEQLPVGNPPRVILRTAFAGRTVYLVTATCCDIPSELYEESGSLICFPAGGFAGGDGRCPEFTLPPSSAIVWRDSRTAQSRTTPASGAK